MSVSAAGKKGGIKRGKELKGTGNPNAKLTPQKADEIRRCKGVATAEGVGLAYGISANHVRAIWRNRYW